MNLTFILPASVDQMLAQHPRILGDVVRADINLKALVGKIHLIRGVYYTLRDPTDFSMFPPRIPYVKKATIHAPGGPCPVCKKLTGRKKAIFCSLKCRSISMSHAKPSCAICGKQVRHPINKYCGRRCYRISMQGKRP